MGKESIKKEKDSRISPSSDTRDMQLQLLKMTKLFRDHTETTTKTNSFLQDELKSLSLDNKEIRRELEKVNKIEKMLSVQAEREYVLGEDLRRVEEENKNLRRELEEFNSFKKGAIWKYLGKYRRVKSLLKEKTGIGNRKNKSKLSIRRIKNSLTTKMFNLYLLTGGTEKVSVVIPVWDRTKELEESIKSILHQSYKNIELIIVTDGSPEETLRVIKEYEDDPRVKVFYYYDNSGNAVRGRNKAIREATGKYFAFQDSDDIADRDRIKNSLKYMKKHNVDGVYGGWRAKVDGTREDTGLKDGQKIISPDCDLKMMKEICVPCQSTVMIKTEVLKKLGGLKTSMRYREDHELWLRFMNSGYKFKAIPEILTTLRLHKGNAELLFKKEDKKWEKEVIKEYKKPNKLKPKIAYIIPSTGIGGGLAVVIQHANRLIKKGYDVLLISTDGTDQITWTDCSAQVVPINSPKRYYFENIDLLIATFYDTVKFLEDIESKRKLYFVQSDERRFFRENEKELIENVQKTYETDYEFFTMAKWIQKWLKDEFNKDAYYVPNGLDTEIFYETKPLEKKEKKIRVLIEGPIDIWFKGMHDAYAAVRNLDIELWIISSAGRPPSYWRYDKFFERVPMDKMKEIYSSCDILLKMSRVEGFFGPPLESMSCGCIPVVSKVTGYDEYIVDGENAMVVEMGDIKGAEKVIQGLIDNPDLRGKLIKNGKKTAKEWSWERSIDYLEKVIRQEEIEKVYESKDIGTYSYKKERKKINRY